jgi:glycosyltransferase involved in cell wall biosynthesis
VALREDCPGTNAINIPNLLIWPSPQGASATILPLDARRQRFVTCGRLVQDKGFDVILEAFSLVALDCPGWDLVIIGDGPSEHSLKALARAKGLEGRVIFLGYSDQANLYYDVCDIFVYASPKEGFGMVIAEAQASGLPAICFDCLAGPSDIVSDQKSGLLISVGDLDGFARAMLQLASDEVLRAQMAGQAGRVAERFGIASIIPRWRSVILKSTKTSGESAR